MWKAIYRLSHLIMLEKKNHIKHISNSYVTDRAAAVFTDYIGIVRKESFAKDFANARYYSVLSDGSTDNAETEQELVYVLYLLKDGVPIVKYLSIGNAKNGDASGLKTWITKAFQRFRITKFSEQLLGLNVDGACENWHSQGPQSKDKRRGRLASIGSLL